MFIFSTTTSSQCSERLNLQEIISLNKREESSDGINGLNRTDKREPTFQHPQIEMYQERAL